MVIETSRLGIATSYNRMSRAQQRMGTGKQLNMPSDDPNGSAQLLALKTGLSRLAQYRRNAEDGRGFLGTTENALSQVTNILRQARQLAVQSANDGIDVQQRQVLADQVTNLIAQVAQISNTQYGGRYIFAGQRTLTPAFVSSGAGSWTYQGGTAATLDDVLQVEVDANAPIQINVSGDKAFSSIFSTLSGLYTNIVSNNTREISLTDVKNLDNELGNILKLRADVGARSQRMEQVRDLADAQELQFSELASNIEEADIPRTVLDLKSAELAYQAALTSAASTFKTSLLDFLR
jgi:flagellar hook-associated protein 3 FlgL